MGVNSLLNESLSQATRVKDKSGVEKAFSTLRRCLQGSTAHDRPGLDLLIKCSEKAINVRLHSTKKERDGQFMKQCRQEQ